MPTQWPQILTALSSHTHCLKVLAGLTSLSPGLQLKRNWSVLPALPNLRTGFALLCKLCHLRQQLCWGMLLTEALHFFPHCTHYFNFSGREGLSIALGFIVLPVTAHGTTGGKLWAGFDKRVEFLSHFALGLLFIYFPPQVSSTLNSFPVPDKKSIPRACCCKHHVSP